MTPDFVLVEVAAAVQTRICKLRISPTPLPNPSVNRAAGQIISTLQMLGFRTMQVEKSEALALGTLSGG